MKELSTVSRGIEGSAGLSRRSFVALSGCAVLTALFGSLGSIPARASEGGTRTITSIDGTTFEVPETVASVAAIFGPSYEKIYALGQEDKITCDGDFHLTGWPWSNVIYQRLDEIPGIENAHSDLNIEDLVAMNVQVVFCFPNSEQVEAVNNAGMYAVPMKSTGAFRDVADTLSVYAQVFNEQDALDIAAAYSDYFDETVAMVQERTADIADEDRPGVYLAYTDMLHAYGSSSDMVEVIDIAGGRLVSQEIEGSSNIEVSGEQLIAWNPDYIFLDHAGSSGNATAEEAIEEALSSGDYDGVTAVIENQVVATPSGLFFWDSGIQKILYLVYIAKTIHPDLFEDIDMAERIMDFYKQFFAYDLTEEEATRMLNHQDPETDGETSADSSADASASADEAA